MRMAAPQRIASIRFRISPGESLSTSAIGDKQSRAPFRKKGCPRRIEFCKYELRGGTFKDCKDKGCSGKSTDRPRFRELMADVRRRLIRREWSASWTATRR